MMDGVRLFSPLHLSLLFYPFPSVPFIILVVAVVDVVLVINHPSLS